MLVQISKILRATKCNELCHILKNQQIVQYKISREFTSVLRICEICASAITRARK